MTRKKMTEEEIKKAVFEKNFVKHGSAQQAALLGIRKGKGDEWELVDITAYGPTATEKYLARILEQKVNQLESKPPIPQSKDEGKPHYTIPMWTPEGG